MIGRVVSIKLKNTATVLVTGTKTHRLYKKSYTTSKKYLVDDELVAKLGDNVEIVKVRPISKRKHWKLIKILGSSIVEIVSEELKKEVEEKVVEVLPASQQGGPEKEQDGTA